VFKNNAMKKNINIKYINIKVAIALALIVVSAVRCTDDYPIDEDGLLITYRGECSVTNFELVGNDFLTVITSTTPVPAVPATETTPAIPAIPARKNVVIDTTAQTIDIEVAFDTDLKNLYPQFTLVQDAKLDPKIVGKVDFSDLANPKRWTVVSGNRKVRKTYTVNITVQTP
jgi:hypothetical protein